MEDLFNPTKIADKTFNDNDTVFCGSGKTENGRFIVSMKLSTKDFKLSDHLKPKQLDINFKIVRKKDVDPWGNSHFVCLAQQGETFPNCAVDDAEGGLLIPLENRNFGFNLALHQIFQLMYNYKGHSYMKLEIVTNGVLFHLFRYLKKDTLGKEQFKISNEKN